MISDGLHDPTVLIGDLVGSRTAADRGALQEDLRAALAVANATCDPAEPLVPTIGDEFQGVFRSPYDAVDATLVVRAGLTPPHDARFGLGIGPVTHLGDGGTPFRTQDGPAWWAARDAIAHVATGAWARDVPRTLRTWLRVPPGPAAEGTAAALNAYLTTRDHLVSRMDARDRRILRLLLTGGSVSDIAADEGISASAVSQRIHRSGAAAIVASRMALRRGSGS